MHVQYAHVPSRDPNSSMTGEILSAKHKRKKIKASGVIQN